MTLHGDHQATPPLHGACPQSADLEQYSHRTLDFHVKLQDYLARKEAHPPRTLQYRGYSLIRTPPPQKDRHRTPGKDLVGS